MLLKKVTGIVFGNNNNNKYELITLDLYLF